MKIHFQRLLSLVGVLLITAGAAAQNYTIDLASIGAGATSTGGGYSLGAGIGLAGAGQLSGGGYTVEAGFWTIPPANAPATIFDNTTGSANGGSGVTATTWLASRFCLGSQSYRLDSVSLLLNSQDSSGGAGPPSKIRLQVYASDPVTGKPSTNTGLIMNLSSHTNPVALLRGQQLVRWTNGTPFTLVADTCYWAVLSRESGGNIGQIASFTKPTGDAGSFGASSSANAGATWGTITLASNNKMLIRGVAEEGAGAPLLSIAGQGADVRIFWPPSATGFVIDQSLTVTGAWSQVAFPYSTNGIDISVSETPAAGNRFYRLRRP